MLNNNSLKGRNESIDLAGQGQWAGVLNIQVLQLQLQLKKVISVIAHTFELDTSQEKTAIYKRKEGKKEGRSYTKS